MTTPTSPAAHRPRKVRLSKKAWPERVSRIDALERIINALEAHYQTTAASHADLERLCAAALIVVAANRYTVELSLTRHAL